MFLNFFFFGDIVFTSLWDKGPAHQSFQGFFFFFKKLVSKLVRALRVEPGVPVIKENKKSYPVNIASKVEKGIPEIIYV